MRHQHDSSALQATPAWSRTLRLGLVAGLVMFAACAEDQAPPPAAGLLTDFASGVDAAFAVETFHATDPILEIKSPQNDQTVIYKGAAQKHPVTMVFKVSNFALGASAGKIRCYLDGTQALTTFKESDATTNTIADLKKPGARALSCELIDKNGTPVAGTRKTIYVQLSEACDAQNPCSKGSLCQNTFCIAGYCKYEHVPNCCDNAYDCAQGETCTAPGTASSKCTSCTADLDCDDGKTCTIDKCDLTGPKGKCTNLKADPEDCCSSGAAGVIECDDGLACTVDACDTKKQKCTHTKQPGVCCFDADCTTSDVCQIGTCVNFECRFNADFGKPDCCSAGTNPKCDDKYSCTIDKCEKKMDGWTQCTHTKDPAKPNCCGKFHNTNECEDGNHCTADFCDPIKEECVHITMPGCCAADKDCDDSNFCTTDKCEKKQPTDPAGLCKYTKDDPACCVSVADCDDGLFCTSDTCNLSTNKCGHVKKDPTCCDKNSECNDGKVCTIGTCVNHGCIFNKHAGKPNCCDSSADCNDGKPCTIDSCDTAANLCKFVDNGDPTCCNGPDDCDDKNCATLNFCDSSNKCAFKKDPSKCEVNLDCDDGNPCTTDSCDTSGACGECKHVPQKNCCQLDHQCDDGKLCTTDTCEKNQCKFTDKKDCCVDDKDAITACDDKNACTIDYCLNNTCRHTAPKNGCCASTADCNDGNKCTTDACQNIVAGKGTCSHTLVDGCSCKDVSECNDNNPCTADSCVGGLCNNKAIDGCCQDKFDCDDGAPCTKDWCVFNYCVNVEEGGGNGLCCSKESEATDCAYLNSECAKGACEVQPDKSRKCVSKPVDLCTVQVNFCQDFSSGTSLKATGWNPGNIKGTAATNWSQATSGGLGPDKYASLTWTPTKTNYDTCLESPIIQAAGSKKITIQYDRLLDIAKGGATSFRLLGSLDGANVDWTKATLIDLVTPSKDDGPATLDVTLPPELTGSNGLRLAFCVAGSTTFDLTQVGLDNVCVVKGGKPTLTACPANQIIKLGGKTTLPIKAKDPDSDAILSFSIVKGPQFVTLSSALYYWLDASWNSTLTINPTILDHVGTHEVTIRVSDGLLYSLCTFSITVTHEGGYLIWRPSEVPAAAGDALYDAVKANVTAVVQQTSDLGLFSNLAKFDGIFVTLGVFPDNHVLNKTNADRLKLYLQQGGHLYMESGDTWAFDSKTDLHPLFHVKAVGDKSTHGVGALGGKHIYEDISQDPKKVYSWAYSADFAWNNLNDMIQADTAVVGTRDVLQSSTNTEKFWSQVTHDNAAAGYRTVASSVLFGGVQKAVDDDPEKMIERVIFFFNNGYVDCSKDAHCNDNDSCTTDKCVSQICQYTNACTCTAANSTALGCTDTKQLVSNGTGSTDLVETYGCDPGTKYDGKEIAYTFSSPTSKPATLTIANLSNSKAKVFLLRAANDGTCDPTACLASSGNGKIDFAAAKGVTYHIVLDVADGGTAQADLSIGCGAGEICNDGKDNNGNSLIDCSDLASCCGDAACGEICDGLDNDCDGKTDEGCDDDGDDYCDATMTTKGTPSTCSKGGGDCNDDNAAMNPGAKEICLNGKDDNCSGGQDEQDAVGCKNYYRDVDADGFGQGAPKCLCAPSGFYKSTKGGDCHDGLDKVHPDATEICGNEFDDDCTGTKNDANAVGCKDFFTDNDGDGYGKLPKKCLCFKEGTFTGPKGGDCDDNDKNNAPGLPEVCDDKDNDCDGVTDEGCDDDKDGYCDNTLKYKSIGGTKDVCGTANEGANLALSCGAGYSITDVTFASYGTPGGSCGGFTKGACDASSSVQKVKDACLGKASCVVAANNTTFGDPCGGVGKKLHVEVVCTSASGSPPKICPKGPGDTNDNDPNINPKGDEVCDGLDNNSNGQTDEKCDKDNDDYCDKDAVVVGAPPTCKKGGGDCNDDNAAMNPGNEEDCNTPWDDDCDGETNDLDAKNCNPLFFDNDADGYGTSDFKCLCTAIGKYKAPKTNDCNDSNPDLHPGVIEICDGKDNNCNGQTDEGCDDDKDGYCDSGHTLAKGGAPICPNGGGDCADTDASINPGKAEVCGDGVDNDCDGSNNDPDAIGCKTFYADADGDSFGSSVGKCICEGAGTFTATNKNDCDDSSADVKPGATEICDDKDNNCDGQTDEGCDDDNDGYCDDKMVVKGTPKVCSKGKGDCDDTAANANPGIAKEICDDKDSDCDGVVDDGCDKDSDGYCDSTYAVSNPPPKVCSKGTGDCNDFNNDQNPAATEVCGNGLDDDCDGSENNENATNCTDFYFDADKDGYGIGIKKCYCKAAGLFTAPQAGDCIDDTSVNAAAAKVNPGEKEICGNGLDDDCSGSQNDDGALNCKDFYLDQDKDGYGLANVKKCLCVGADSYTASAGGDCDDTKSAVSPGKTEVCDDIDNDCDSKVDTGCNDDGDDYCDKSMTTVGFPNVCVKGGGDCDDTRQQVNPGHTEWCDDLDNNCNSTTDEKCDDDNDDHCDADMTTVGKPSTCTKGGGDCKDEDNTVNPSQKEKCSTTKDDDCSGSTNDEGATGCTNFGVDADGDTYSDKNGATKCLCKADGVLTGTKSGDCNDANKLINPAVIELCDGVDNNCNGAVDEGCDGDKDGYCDSSKTTIGAPSVCPKGGGDCDDTNANINPGVKEVCGNSVDENCDSDLNGINATGCTNFYYDGDGDGYAVSLSQCLCSPKGAYKISDTKKLGDCDDTKGNTNPAATEVCGDGIDNNCNGTQNDPGASGCKNFYKDNDKDGYGGTAAACLCVAEGTYVTPLGGDCNESDVDVNPGKAEQCDGKDNNCAGGADEGCDNDGDKYCDSNMVTIGTPGVCPNGGGDCDDTKSTVHPGVTEICDNIDQDCDGTADNLCDADNDGYCDKNKTIVGSPSVCNKGKNDCNDSNALVNPGKSEICDDEDNNCDGKVDENCDVDGDGFCTNTKSVIGTPSICIKGVGDCDDSNDKVYPGAPEECNGKDDNCGGGIDETCNDNDGDGYCTGNVSASKGCPNGGGDCNDDDPSVHPGANEDCNTPLDDNCNGQLNEKDALNCVTFFSDTDGDGYGDGTGACYCQQQNKFTATRGGDCDENNVKIHPGATEQCDGVNNDCDFKPLAGATYKGQTVNMNTRSYGGTYHMFRKEYWYPQWSGSTVYRYDDKYQLKGTHSTGLGNHYQIAGDPLEDNYYTIRYTGSSSHDRVRKHKGTTSSILWTAPYQTTYLSALAADKNGVYAMRYNSSTVYVFNRSNGSKTKQYNLSGHWDGNYVWGGLFVADGKLYRAAYNTRWFYRYDINTGAYDGFSFQVAPTVYNTAYNGKDVCVSSGGSSVYCYNVPSSTTFKLRTIGIDPKSRGGGFHLKHKEYWYPHWSGGDVYRYDLSNNYVGKFSNGLSSVSQLWGTADENDYYLTRYTSSSSSSRIYKLKDKSNQQLWNTYVTTYMSGVAADDKYVYAMRYNSNHVYILDKTNGQRQSSKEYNLSGDYDGNYMYGGLAVVDGKLFRATYNSRNVYRYDLATGVHDGMKFRVDDNVYGTAYNGSELCYNDTNGLPYCYKVPSAAITYKADVVGVNPQSYGGGYHLFRKEYWYPNYTSGNTTVYRYKDDYKLQGTFQTGQPYVRGITSDTDEDNYYLACYSSSSTIGRVRKMKGMSSQMLWQSDHVNYFISTAVHNGLVYSAVYNSNHIYVYDKATGNRVSNKEFNVSGNSTSTNYGGIAIHNNLLYRTSANSDVTAHNLTNGGYAGIRFKTPYAAYGTAYTGKKFCVHNSSSYLPDCYDLDAYDKTKSTTYDGSGGKPNVTTYSYGGGYHPYHKEWWFPQWASSTIRRYNSQKQYVGAFNTGMDRIGGVDGDVDNHYYVTRFHSSTSYNYSYVEKYQGIGTSKVWSTRYNPYRTYLTDDLTGVALHKDHIYVMTYNNNHVYALKKSTGERDGSKDFNFKSYPYFGTAYGGMTIVGDTLWRTSSDGYIYGFKVGSGTYEGVAVYTGFAPYSVASDGNELCYGNSSSSSKMVCTPLPTDTNKLKPEKLGMATYSYGGGFHPFYNEYWYPEYNTSTVHRYNTQYKEIGTFDMGFNDIRAITGHKSGNDAYVARYTGSSSTSRIYKVEGGTSNIVNTSPYLTTYLSGVAVDDDYVYTNRYNSQTIYRLKRTDLTSVNNFALTGQWSGSSMYGGLTLHAGKLYRATTDRWVYRYDVSTGAFDGVMWQVPVAPYSSANNGTHICYGDSTTARAVYCHPIPAAHINFNGRPLGIDVKSNGGGFHAFHNEYWFPQWSGGWVWRYGVNNAPLGKFDTKLTSTYQLWGEKKEDAFYTVQYNSSSSYSKVRKLKGKSSTVLWTAPNLSSYMSGVAADDDYVYAMRYSGMTVWKLSKSNGSLIESFNLSGTSSGNYLYGGLVVENGKLWRADSSGYTYRYDLQTKAYDGMSLKMNVSVRALAYNGTELCASNGSLGSVYCYSIYDTDSPNVDEGCDDDDDDYCDSDKVITANGVKVTCPKSKQTCDGTEKNGFCYKAVNSGTTWDQAKTACEDWGGNLAGIDNSTENGLVQQTANAACGNISYWIGYNDKESEGLFSWIDGISGTFTNWKSGFPVSKTGTTGGTTTTGGKKYVLTKYYNSSYGPTREIGTIPGKPGQKIIIHKVGVCGDSDNSSGPNRFKMTGGGINYSWSAGRNDMGSGVDFLGFTPATSGSGKGFVYKDVNYKALQGQSVKVDWDYHYDWDGHYCLATDSEGNSYSDPSSSIRGWVLYSYSNNSNGKDGVAADFQGKWQDVDNSSKLNCYVCKRKLTAAQYGKGDDCADDDKTQNPATAEVCDGKDNNCDGVIDEGCDDDQDGYCDANMLTVGTPSTCVKGGADCDDYNANINPGKTESCLTDFDDNCDGTTSQINAEGCVNLFYDGDGDGYGTSSFQCQCLGQTCSSEPWKETFEGTTLTGWKLQKCAAGTQTEPTSCTDYSGTQGWQHHKAGAFVADGKGALYYGDPSLKTYNFGASAGRALSSKFTVPASGTPTIKASIYTGIDNGATTDHMSIRVREAATGKVLKTLWTKKDGQQDHFPGSKILKAADKIKLNAWYGNASQDWSVCYRKSQHGGNSYTFHSLCDNKGPTITVIKSNVGNVFGGYTAHNWSGGGYGSDSTAWLFSLTKNYKSPLRGGGSSYATYRTGSYGPTFGHGHDLHVRNNMNSGYTYFGYRYTCPVGSYGSSACQNYLAGNYSSWSVPELEVWYRGKSTGGGSVTNKWNHFEFDASEVAGKEVQLEIYFNTVNTSNNTGLGIIVDNVSVTDSTCNKYTAAKSGDCDDTNALKYPSTGAEICDGVDNNCNGTIDEACDTDKDGYCDSKKPVFDTYACPKTASSSSTTCTTTTVTTPIWDGKRLKYNTYGNHGATYHAFRKEYWFSNWSSNTTLYRYSKDWKYLGAHSTSTYYSRDIAADPNSDHYYTGSYYNYRVYKRKGITNNHVWSSYYMSYYVGGVAADKNYVYAMRYHPSYRTVYFLRHNDGGLAKTINLSGDFGGSVHGGLVVLDGKLWRGTSDRWVREYNLADGKYTGRSFQASMANYNSFIMNDAKYCTSDGGSNIDCYDLFTTSCKEGDDCNDQQADIHPDAAESCDDLDNDCDKTVDEECDVDNDGYCAEGKAVVGAPATCKKGGGDCDDKDNKKNPGSTEVCDGKDNNCDKVVDEENASGCQKYYYDGDLDGFGLSSSHKCLCKAAGLFNATKTGDCDDTCKDCKPITGAATKEESVCDDKDQDCDGSVDEGCDKDGDGWCSAAKTTILKPKVCPKGGSDCDDTKTTLSPGATELCNNVDDNCNGITDENASNFCNAQMANGKAACEAGKCVDKGCADGFYNLNGTISDGCECNGNDIYEPNNSCATAATISNNLQDKSGGTSEAWTGMMVEASDVDWYKVYARDLTDSGSSACDRFSLRVRFLKNPGNRYRFSIWRGACPTSDTQSADWWKAGHGRHGNPSSLKKYDNNVCCAQTDFNWFTNFKAYSKHSISSYESEWGECSCHNNYSTWSYRTGWNYGPSNGKAGPYGMRKNQHSPGMGGDIYMPSDSYGYGYAKTWCNDDSAWFYIKVYKATGSNSCGGYAMEASNAVYSPSSKPKGYNYSGQNKASPKPQ